MLICKLNVNLITHSLQTNIAYKMSNSSFSYITEIEGEGAGEKR